MRTLYLGTLAGCRIYIHWSFWLLTIAIFAWTLPHGLMVALTQLLLVLAFFFCVFLHELGHALAARWFGIRTRDITLLPIGGIARIEGSELRPVAEGVIAAAGPAVNALIAVSMAAGLSISRVVEHSSQGAFQNLNFGEQLAFANFILAAANMLPAFPLDGGRVMRSILCRWWPKPEATQITSRVGQWTAGLLMIYCLYYLSFSGLLMGAILFAINYGHWFQARFLMMPDDLREQMKRQMDGGGDFNGRDLEDGNTIDAVEVRQVK